ncbi:hypothetical protein [Pseudophaeobacter arcticus]|jgi:hypothetical protein|uniref:hypothetical protein n=1 Tax=Pseudophaeobacter arcticus TaxID=385492 RepID=UPI0039E70F0E
MPLDKPSAGKTPSKSSKSSKTTKATPARSLRFCVFGDSHIACVKHALDEGLLDLKGIELEFWGAPGPQFRDLHLEEGRLVGTSAAARDSLARINPARSAALDPQDFDGFLFIGCRLRSSEFLVPLLASQPGSLGYLSQAVRDLMLPRWLEGCRWYRAAREFAKQRPVFFSPAGFLNDGIVSEDEVARTVNIEATQAERDVIWDQIAKAMEEDKIQLIRQPEDTVTRGGLTRAAFATSLGDQGDDSVHKNGAYGALILNQALGALRAMQK